MTTSATSSRTRYCDTETRACKEFLEKVTTGLDPTWGFYVYATYTRPQGQEEVDSDQNSSSNKTAVDDDTYFQDLLNKFHALATKPLRDSYPERLNQKIIDSLRLVPAAIMPGASLSDVCTHFLAHHARILDSEREDEPGYRDAFDEEGLWSPKYNWCMIVDDECLVSFGNADDDEDGDAFAKLLSGTYTTMEKPVALTAKCRNGTGGTKWNGWFKFAPLSLKEVFEQADVGEIETFFRGEDVLWDGY